MRESQLFGDSDGVEENVNKRELADDHAPQISQEQLRTIEEQKRLLAAKDREIERLKKEQAAFSYNSNSDFNSSHNQYGRARQDYLGSAATAANNNKIDKNIEANREDERLKALYARARTLKGEDYSLQDSHQQPQPQKVESKGAVIKSSKRGRDADVEEIKPILVEPSVAGESIEEQNIIENETSSDREYREALSRSIAEEYQKADLPTQAQSANVVARINLETASSSCREGQEEVDSARVAGDAADKLFHLRRALRLCPNEALFHLELARLYRTLARKADATFEYQEALSINPNLIGVKEELNQLNSEQLNSEQLNSEQLNSEQLNSEQ
jgi:hypothetical protein